MKFDQLKRFLVEFRVENHCSTILNYSLTLDPLHESMKRNLKWVVEDPQHKRMMNQLSLVKRVKTITNCLALKPKAMISVVKVTNEFESRKTLNKSLINEYNQRYQQLIIFLIPSFKNKAKNLQSKIPKQNRFTKNHSIKTCLIKSKFSTLRN